MKCSKCGAELAEGVKFCRECGAKAEIPKKQFCRECGAKFVDNTKFCTSCGAKIETGFTENKKETEQVVKKDNHAAEGASEPTNTIEENTHNPQIKTVQTSENKDERSSQATVQESPKSTQKIGKKQLIIIVSIAVAVLLVTVLAFLIGRSSTPRRASSPVTTTETTKVTEIPEGMIAMINVVDMSYNDAVTALKTAGFTNVTVNGDSNVEESKWVVVKQSVSKGKYIYPDDQVELTCFSKCKLYLDITSEFNFFFSKYDITIQLDGKELGSVSNGNEFSYMADVLSGNHTLLFHKSGDTSLKSTKSFEISGDTTFSCCLSHGSDYIGIMSERIEKGISELTDKPTVELTEAATETPTSAPTQIPTTEKTTLINVPDGFTVLQAFFCNCTLDDKKEDIEDLAQECGLYTYNYASRSDHLDMEISAEPNSEKKDYIYIDFDTYTGSVRLHRIIYYFNNKATESLYVEYYPTRWEDGSEVVSYRSYDIKYGDEKIDSFFEAESAMINAKDIASKS